MLKFSLSPHFPYLALMLIHADTYSILLQHSLSPIFPVIALLLDHTAKVFSFSPFPPLVLMLLHADKPFFSPHFSLLSPNAIPAFSFLHLTPH